MVDLTKAASLSYSTPTKLSPSLQSSSTSTWVRDRPIAHAMMDPSTFAQHQQLVQQQQQQMLIALSQLHHSQGIQMTHPQHPFQQGFEQQHRNHIEEQPAPIAGTAGATTTTR